MKLVELFHIIREDYKVSIRPMGQNYDLVSSGYRPHGKYSGEINKNFLIARKVLTTNFGKFFIRCLQTPITNHNQNLRNAGIRIAKRYGVPLQELPDRFSVKDGYGGKQYMRRKFSWNAQNLYVPSLDQNDIFHELAHWVVSTREGRKNPEFGLGNSSFGSSDELASTKPGRPGELEEYEATVLEMCWTRALRGDSLETLSRADAFGEIPSELRHRISHNQQTMWIMNTPYLMGLGQAFERLIQSGLIDAKGNPNWAVRVSESKLDEKYSSQNSQFLNYMEQQPVDHYQFWHLFPEWLENQLDTEEIDQDQYDSIMAIFDDEDPETFHEMPDNVQKGFEEFIRQEAMDQLMQNDPADAPTWAHAHISRKKLLPRTTWLVHFTNDADSIAQEGFRYGVDDMTKLGLTTWFKNEGDMKRHGGYNFAVIAGSRDMNNIARQRKYGKQIVLFQNSGVQMYHHGDEEYQIVFNGADVDPRSIIVIKSGQEADWGVYVHPNKRNRYPRETLFEAESLEACVEWAIKNLRQYARLITGY